MYLFYDRKNKTQLNKLKTINNIYLNLAYQLKRKNMKKILSLLFILMSLSFIGCGPSQEEEEKEKRRLDSLMEPERDAAIENANKLLGDTIAKDSTAKIEVVKDKKKK